MSRALAELQKKNEDLLEQLQSQQQLQKELQAQLHESQRSCAQLRTQVTPFCLLTCLMGSHDRRVLTSLLPSADTGLRRRDGAGSGTAGG